MSEGVSEGVSEERDENTLVLFLREKLLKRRAWFVLALH